MICRFCVEREEGEGERKRELCQTRRKEGKETRKGGKVHELWSGTEWNGGRVTVGSGESSSREGGRKDMHGILIWGS